MEGLAGLVYAANVGKDRGVTILDITVAIENFGKLFPDRERSFSMGDAAMIAGFSISALGKWIDLRIVCPSVIGGKGRGHAGKFTYVRGLRFASPARFQGRAWG